MNTHELDQMMAGLRDISTMLFEYRKRLEDAGFTKNESFRLVIEYQKIMLTK